MELGAIVMNPTMVQIPAIAVSAMAAFFRLGGEFIQLLHAGQI